MLSVFVAATGALRKIDPSGGALPPEAVWIDLKAPTPAEEQLVEDLIGIEVPTREDLQEIEISSRLYSENGARYMTATLMCGADTAAPRTTPVSFILAAHRLITVRYDEPKAFPLVAAKLGRACPATLSGDMVMLDLLDTVIDRCADVLERAGSGVDSVSAQVFEASGERGQAHSYSQILRTIGRKGDLTSKVRESLVSIGRLISFVTVETEGVRWSKEQKAQLKTMQRDVQSLTDHASYLSNKITFVLDAMLGVVNLEQNNIIKLFSVMAVVLMPPTLIASIYGMNFRFMPELEWPHAYPLVLGAMVLAAIGPYLFFKWKKWL
ncbi:MAG: magnesium transporter CorA family protein [Xanthobacteraceae bacterium]